MRDILIVEDGNQERERLNKLFTADGYTVSACQSVREAEEELKSHNFRLAILDIGLSDKSGSYLFNTIKRLSKVNFIIIFTGNPSVHLKQRFMEEGAADYIVKASPEAQNERFLNRVRELIGNAEPERLEGIDLRTFLMEYLPERSRKLFYDENDALPPCSKCGGDAYKVIFSGKTQIPPEVIGQVICSHCQSPMDPNIE